MKISFALAVLGMGLACERAPQEPVSSKTGTQEAQTEAPQPKEASAPKKPKTSEAADLSGEYRLPDASRIVAIGDLHGDFSATERAFALAGAIDKKGAWIGGKLVVVQTGDQLDRGDGEQKIIEFLSRLAREAKKAGGALVVLNGNHETMNVMGDFRYVTAGARDSFASYKPASPLATGTASKYRKRAEAFLPGGGAAKILSERRLIVMVGKTAFVHGGVLPHHVDYGIDRLNEETKRWMLGETSQPPSLVLDPQGPVWTRLYGEPQLSEQACKVLAQTLRKLGAERLVVGHTVQRRGMSGACGDRVFRVDVGLSSYYGEHPVQVLEIANGAAKILSE